LLIGASLAVYLRVIKPWQMRQRYVLAYETTIAQQCAENQLDPYLVSAMIYCEFHLLPGAVSGVGARGLMQIMPETADWLAWRMELRILITISCLIPKRTSKWAAHIWRFCISAMTAICAAWCGISLRTGAAGSMA
jgi:hypothetical protein